jgi:HSP20 family molecular chaperone IbpA
MSSALLETKKSETPAHAEMERPNNDGRRYYVPRADIYESTQQIVVLADMPGVKQNNIDITLEQNILTIHGRVDESEVNGFSQTYTEYGVGDYKRVFSLSNEIDREGIQATVKNGVLKLVLPKSKRALPRKIEVSVD